MAIKDTINKVFKENKKEKELNKRLRLRKSRNSLLFVVRHSLLSTLAGLSFKEHIKKHFTNENGKSQFDSIRKSWSKVNDTGVQVSLYINDTLRGSYGELVSDENVYSDVIRFARKAAFEDNRFPPLIEKELKKVKIEIFLINQDLKPILYNDPMELLIQLGRLKDNGIMVQKGNRNSYYLPDTWDMIPDPSLFISSLCSKAGLPPSAWRGEKRLWPRKRTEKKINLYTGKILEPEEYSGIDVLRLQVKRINGMGLKK